MLGTASFAVILCKFNDIAIPDLPSSFFENAIAAGGGGLYDYWNDVSYAQLNLNNSAVFGWYTMQYSFFENTTQPRGTWIAEARRLAGNAGVDLAKFHGVIAVVNAGGGHYLSTKYGVDEGEQGVDVSVDVPGVWGQNDWRWCKKCQTLNYAGLTTGACPAGGDHDDSSSNSYSLALNQPEFPGQIDWRWCKKCQALNYGAGTGACSAGGEHDNSASGDYTLSINSGNVKFVAQNQWKWCNKCQVLAYSGFSPGPCAAGGTHNSASDDYVLVSALDQSSFNNTFLGHETGHSLGLGHSWLASPETVYGNPWDIMSAMSVHDYSNSAYPVAGPGVNAPNLDYMGWLPNIATWTPASVTGGNETIQLLALNQPELGYLAAKVPKADSMYYVEYRQPTGWDQAIPRAAVFINEDRSWLWCRKCQELTLAAANPPGPCAGGGTHDHTGSGYYTLLHNTPSGDPGQSDWCWCNKCQALAYDGGPAGACPGGGSHNFQGSNNYTLVHDTAAAYGQSNWRWCSKCQALNYAGQASAGPCPAGGTHNTASDNYAITVDSVQRHSFLLGDSSGNVEWQPGDVFTDKNRGVAVVIHSFSSAGPALATVSISSLQNLWQWCSKCQGLAYGGSPTAGPCPAGGSHDHTGSSDYSLLHDLPGNAVQSNWRWCSKCQGLAYAGISQGVCPAGGTHNIASDDYGLLHDSEISHAQGNWRWCNKCQGLAYAGISGGVCPAGGTHNPDSDDYYVINV